MGGAVAHQYINSNHSSYGGLAELVDAHDLGSCVLLAACGFESHVPYHLVSAVCGTFETSAVVSPQSKLVLKDDKKKIFCRPKVVCPRRVGGLLVMLLY